MPPASGATSAAQTNWPGLSFSTVSSGESLPKGTCCAKAAPLSAAAPTNAVTNFIIGARCSQNSVARIVRERAPRSSPRHRARYEPDLKEDVLIASNAKSATDEQLACADKAVSFYTLELPLVVQPHDDAIPEARLSGPIQEGARAWLAARGLRAPKYQEGVTNDATFTRQVEHLCGRRAKGAFQSKFGFHALSPDWAKRELRSPKPGGDAFYCLMNLTAAAGFKVVLIGNEYYKLPVRRGSGHAAVAHC
jgi:hypothetical protein